MYRTLIVVPTAGNFEIRLSDGSLVPTKTGELRLEKATELMKSHPYWELVIVGGKRKNPDETEAQIYHHYLWRNHPTVAARIKILLDDHKCTVLDMEHLAWELDDYTKYSILDEPFTHIVLVTHPDHAKIAEISLYELLPNIEVMCEPSGEDSPYPTWVQNILLWVTRRDPLWQKLWSLPFRMLTSIRENPPNVKPKP